MYSKWPVEISKLHKESKRGTMTDEIWWLNIVTQLGRAKVLMKNRNNDHRMGGTLEKNWIGPYEIVEILSKGTMKLKNCSNDNLLKTAQHASN